MLNRVLATPLVPRTTFDPKNKEHRASLKKFLDTGSWGSIQFFPEEPYVTVPETVLRKFALHNLQKV
jgi:hypothetical protein